MCRGLEDLVLPPLEEEAQHWDAPLVDDAGVDLAVALLVGDHFAQARERDVEPYNLRKSRFKSLPVSAAVPALIPCDHAGGGHLAAAAELDGVAAREGHLPLSSHPACHVHAAAAVVVGREPRISCG